MDIAVPPIEIISEDDTSFHSNISSDSNVTGHSSDAINEHHCVFSCTSDSKEISIIMEQDSVLEYLSMVFSYAPIGASIHDMWGHHFEDVLEPAAWNAKWKIPDNILREYEITDITETNVKVLEILYMSKLAVVTVDEDIFNEDSLTVDLVHLYPTWQQDNQELEMTDTALALNHFRFFYSKLWFPWDEEAAAAAWRVEHLEIRVKFYFDRVNGKVPEEMKNRIDALLEEASGICCQQEEVDTDDEMLEENAISTMLELHLRLQDIRKQIELLEEPLLRKVMMQQKESMIQVPDKHCCRIIWAGGSYTDLQDFIKKASTFAPSCNSVLCYPNLQSALSVAQRGDSIVLQPGTHYYRQCCEINNLLLLTGTGSPMETTIVPVNSTGTAMALSSSKITIANVKFDCGDCCKGITVRMSNVHIRNCYIVSKGMNIACSVSECSRVEMETTELSGWRIAVEVKEQGVAKLNGCKINDGRVGVLQKKDGSISMNKTEMLNLGTGIEVCTASQLPSIGDIDTTISFRVGEMAFTDVFFSKKCEKKVIIEKTRKSIAQDNNK